MDDDQPKKQLGQHWLTDQPSLVSIVDKAELSSSDSVLEVGPGRGDLTQLLVQSHAHVTAVEFDNRLIGGLRQRFKGCDNFSLVEADIRKFNLSLLPQSYKIVANIPYYLTANLLRMLTDTHNKPSLAVLLVQKEVAEKIAGSSKSTLLRMIVEMWYRTEVGAVVEAAKFIPPPKVDSQVIVLKARPKPMVGIDTWPATVRLLKAGFSNPRKKLINNLASSMSFSKEEVGEFLSEVGLDSTIRPHQLTIDEWVKLLEKIG